ncbi:MAG: hypothetical protein KKB38_20185 [Gammaproteobacteria bacterium]|nr:hypothetical protein [Gammaproteobacteria bacterium]
MPVSVFDSNWRKACSIRKCSITEVDDFIKAHYLKKRPAIVLLCLVAEKGRERIGCIVYSAPSREVNTRYGGKVWELARLYLLDEIPRNAETWLIGQSVKYIKQHHRDVCHLLSYADPSAGHDGVIYKAANWKLDGRTDDDRKTPRCDYYDGRTGKKYGRRGNMPTDAVVVKKPRVSKWRFTLAL